MGHSRLTPLDPQYSLPPESTAASSSRVATCLVCGSENAARNESRLRTLRGSSRRRFVPADRPMTLARISHQRAFAGPASRARRPFRPEARSRACRAAVSAWETGLRARGRVFRTTAALRIGGFRTRRRGRGAENPRRVAGRRSPSGCRGLSSAAASSPGWRAPRRAAPRAARSPRTTGRPGAR